MNYEIMSAVHDRDIGATQLAPCRMQMLNYQLTQELKLMGCSRPNHVNTLILHLTCNLENL